MFQRLVSAWGVIRRRGILSALLALGLWEIFVSIGILPSRYIPPPTIVGPELIAMMGESAFWMDIGSTLQGYIIGLSASVLIAVPLGLLIGSHKYLYHATRVTIEFLRPIPSVAIIPLAVLILGITMRMKIFLVVYATFWPLIIQSIYGARDVDPVMRDTARSLGFSSVRTFFFVTIPSAAPYIATGLRIASALAIILAVTAELVAGVDGLGKTILLAQGAGAYTTLYALIIATGIISYLLSYLVSVLERHALHWHISHRPATL